MPATPSRLLRDVDDEPISLAASSRFRTIREIARGGMGRVVEAEDTRLGRHVAKKEMLDDHPELRRRFEREIAITARLEHPSIVPVYDAGATETGEPFYVMRKVTGAPLDRLIAETKGLDQRLLFLPNMLAVANAVAHAHGRGVIHRDLKPSNVLIGELGETIVIDWGLAKLVADPDDVLDDVRGDGVKTAAGVVCGTVGFMPREQLLGEDVDARADVYALGVCLYFVLAGRLPFGGLALAEIESRTLYGPDEPLERHVEGVPRDLVTIVETAMARDREARYIDAGGLAEDLQRFLAGQLVASHRYTATQRLVRWLRRHKALVVASAIGVAVAVAIGAISIVRIVREQQRTAAALARELERSDENIVNRAIALLGTDPTSAVATLQTLRAESPQWSRLGSVVAEARARGVAVGYPGHGVPAVQVALPHDPSDRRVLTSGGKTIRLHDLAAHTSTVLATGDHAVWCEPLVFASEQHDGTLLDPRTGQRQSIALPSHLRSAFAVAPGVLLYVGADGGIVSIDTTRGLPLRPDSTTRIPTAAPVNAVWASPSGRIVMASDRERTTVLTREAGAWRPRHVFELVAESFAFDAGETRLAMIASHPVRTLVELDLTTLATRQWSEAAVLWTGYANDILHAAVIDPQSASITPGIRNAFIHVRRYDETNPRVVAQLDKLRGGPVLASIDGALAVLEASRRIAITRGGATQIVRPPMDIAQIAAHPKGHDLVAVSATQILAFDLRQSIGEHVHSSAGAELGFVGRDRLLALGETEGMTRPAVRMRITEPFSLAIESSVEVGVMHGLVHLDHGVAIASELSGVVVGLVEPALALPTTTSIVEGASSGVLIGGTSGTISHLDRASGARTELGKIAHSVAGLAESDGWFAAHDGRGTIWRRSPGGQIATASWRDAVGVAIDRTGGIIAFGGTKLARWPTSASGFEVLDARALVDPVLRAWWLPDGRIGLVTAAPRSQQETIRIHDPATASTVQVLEPADRVTLSGDRTRVVAALRGGIVVADLRSGEHWQVVDHHSARPLWLALSPDGATLIAAASVRTGFALTRWQLDVPGLHRDWVLGATNAIVRSARGDLEWRPLGSNR